MFNFVFDRRNDHRPYPNLAPLAANPHESYHGLGDDYPWIAPCRLLLYCADHAYPVHVSYADEPVPPGAYYPVGLAWFDYTIDYFALIPERTLELIRSRQLRVLFYYHEGDDPGREQARLNDLCVGHELPVDCYQFISGNTSADDIKNFVYFADHELFYWRNSVVWNGVAQPGESFHLGRRTHRYTVLNRFHKWWRASIMAELQRNHILDHSYWSYNNIQMGDRPEDNPIAIDYIPGLRDQLNQFMAGAPYHCDELTTLEHNSHWLHVPEHYADSYFHIVLETLFDAEQSGGAFITEKTFKPIRHAQPFVMFGCANTLQTLRLLGYHTYDLLPDLAYDHIVNNTERARQAVKFLRALNELDLHGVYTSLEATIRHNQQVFLGSKWSRLNTLHKQLLLSHND